MPDESHPLTGLAAYLVQDELLDATRAFAAVKYARAHTITLSRYLVQSQIIASTDILNCCARHYGLPVFDLAHYDVTRLSDPVLKPELIQRYRILPLYRDATHLHIGIADPSDPNVSAALNFHTGLHIQFMLVDEHALDKILKQHTALDARLASTLTQITPQEETPFPAEKNDEPISEFVEHLIQDAVNKNISDIHIEPGDQIYRIRFRRDGLLYEVTTVPLHLAARIITRLKILANINIAERRLPQDGRIQLKQENKMNIRMNVCPTLWGEKIVLRILNSNKLLLTLDALGLQPEQITLLKTALAQPQGLVLVTGPTGSGKTATLYAALQYLNRVETNIICVEDPIEIAMPGIHQINVNPSIGLDFMTVLRSVMRQDPDVLMVGEIRDRETALTVIQAAQTGHLVLSTLHTNNTIETLTRLKAMHINTQYLNNALTLILSQRLVRVLCSYCKQKDPKLPGYLPTGCSHCRLGYQSRTGIFELLPYEPNLTQDPQRLRAQGMQFLWDIGMQKVHAGITSISELHRTLGSNTITCEDLSLRGALFATKQSSQALAYLKASRSTKDLLDCFVAKSAPRNDEDGLQEE